MSKDEQRNKLVEDRLVVEHTRERLAAARARGGAELHMSLDEIDVLVRYSSAAITGYMRLLDKGKDG
jgi:hypothetical protein